jgi:3-polyprenyl-4-hydroxybenzoate decarboxylase
MAYDDLRGWLSKVDSMGELKRIEVADWDLEMACFADPKVSGDLTSVFLFDKIKGYPSGSINYPKADGTYFRPSRRLSDGAC